MYSMQINCNVLFYVRLTCANGGSDKMAGGLSGDGDITDELIPTGRNNYLINN